MLLETLILMGARVALDQIVKELNEGRIAPPTARERMKVVGDLVSKAAQEFRDA